MKKRLTNVEAGILEIATILKSPHSNAANKVLDDIARRYDIGLHRFLQQVGLFPTETSYIWHQLLEVRFIRSVCDEKLPIATAIQGIINKSRKLRPATRQLMREVFRGFFLEVYSLDLKNSEPPSTPQSHWQIVFEGFTTEFLRKNETPPSIPGREFFTIYGNDFSPPFLEIYQDDPGA